MTARDLVKAFLERLVQLEVERLLPQAAALIPGLPGELLKSLLQSPAVQAELVKLETEGVDAGVDFLAKEIDQLKVWAEDHTKGGLHAALEVLFSVQPPPSLHLSAEQVRQLAALAAAGRLNGVLQQGLKDLGLSA